MIPNSERTPAPIFKAALVPARSALIEASEPPPLQAPKLWSKVFSRRGKLKIPKAFPRFESSSFMFVVWSDVTRMTSLLEKMRVEQHTFWKTAPHFKCSLVQGEFSPENKPHLQGVVQFKNKTQTTALYKIFAPYLPNSFGLQVAKTGKLKAAWHYCAKPHNGCDCEHCEKARKCKENWAPPVQCGEAPVGQGKKFEKFRKAMEKNPTKKVMIEGHLDLYCRYGNNMEKVMEYYQEKQTIESYRVKPEALEKLSNYQLGLCINEAYNTPHEVNPRDIFWLWSRKLGTGKTLMMSFIKYLVGIDKCMDGMKSYRHCMNAYNNERVVHFNFANGEEPEQRDLNLIENMDDGGFRQPPMYRSKKKVVRCKVYVTANVPPPPHWCADRGTEARISSNICLDPPGFEYRDPDMPYSFVHPM